jgi:hypothetical protein
MGETLLPILVYTHTDMTDVCAPFFGQLKKYMPDYKGYVCINRQDDIIPKDYIQIYYDDTKSYTDRLVEILNQINEDIFLFTHEDMILFDTPDYNYLAKYYKYVSDRSVDSIKLVYSGDGGGIKSPVDETLVLNEYSKFSIQPTIIRRNILLQIAEGVGSKNIWEFENAIVGSGMDFSARRGDEKKRGIFHFDSFVYPFICTAINKGKWNMTEYKNELNPIFEEYGINPFDRGIW